VITQIVAEIIATDGARVVNAGRRRRASPRIWIGDLRKTVPRAQKTSRTLVTLKLSRHLGSIIDAQGKGERCPGITESREERERDLGLGGTLEASAS
jgi:hypothetical protein